MTDEKAFGHHLHFARRTRFDRDWLRHSRHTNTHTQTDSGAHSAAAPNCSTDCRTADSTAHADDGANASADDCSDSDTFQTFSDADADARAGDAETGCDRHADRA